MFVVVHSSYRRVLWCRKLVFHSCNG